MTNTSHALRSSVRFALAAAASTMAAPAALAQTAPAAPAPAPIVQEVVVTGSRIMVPNEVSISPVTSVTALDVQQTGLTRVEDMLNNLPQVISSQSSSLSISADGTATVDLRGLSPQRTLVLINGRRLTPGNGSGRNYADVNQIPAALIERVDVLTGGASAVYGADAVAGVVNFVMNTHFDGVKLDANYAFDQHHNSDTQAQGYLAAFGAPKPPSNVNAGFTKDLSFIAGSNFADGKGNATVYATYLNQGAAVQSQYDYSGCTLNTPDPIVAGAHPACGGSGTGQYGQFIGNGLVGGHAASIFDLAVDPHTGQLRPFNAATDLYNYGALSYFLRPSERYTAGAFLNVDVSEHTNVYSEFMYAKNTSTAQYGPSGDFFNPFTYDCVNNPLLTAAGSSATQICSAANLAAAAALGAAPGTINGYIARRNVEGGGRLDNYSSDAFHVVLGIKGSFGDAWSYDAYGEWGITQFSDRQENFLSNANINNALNVVTDPATGQPACASAVAGTDKACVPWNIWVPGGVSAAALKYLSIPLIVQSEAKEYVASGSVTGDLGKYGAKFPTAASGLIVNIGAEYRQEQAAFNPDLASQQGAGAGGNGAIKPLAGEFHVSEVFTELKLPILDEQPGAYQLGAEAGYRYSTYTEGFNTNTYKIGLDWAPIRDVRFRGSYNRAVRAPNIGELYTPAVVGAGGTSDPCWGTAPVFSAAQCANTGVTASEYGHILVNQAAQINTQVGGNANLVPEIADTYSFGVLLEPQAVPNLHVSIDYFDIKVKGTIALLASSTILNNCAVSGTASLCSLIHRGPTGSLWLNTDDYVATIEQNIGSQSTKGIDLKANYRLSTDSLGKFGFSLEGSRTTNFLTQPLPTGAAFDCAGYFGSVCNSNNNPTPKWRHVLTTNWSTPWANLDLTLRWRFIGAMSSDRTSSDPQLAQTYYPGAAHIPTYSYLDVSGAIPLAHGINLRLGINNLLDKNPPLVLNGTFTDCPNLGCNGNTFPGVYDALGRYVYAHLTAQF